MAGEKLLVVKWKWGPKSKFAGSTEAPSDRDWETDP